MLRYQRGIFNIAIITLFSVLSGIASATNDICGCNAGLAQEVLATSSNRQLKLAYLKQVDQKQWEEIRKSGSLGGTYKGISIDLDYSEMSKRRSELFEKERFNMSESEAQSLVLTTVKTRDWGECKKMCIAAQSGFVCDASDMTADVLAVSCSWRPTGPSPQFIKVSVSLNGKKIEPVSIERNTVAHWQYGRDPKRDMLVTFNGPYGGQTVRADRVPPEQPLPQAAPVKIGECIGRGGVEGVHFYGPQGENCNNISAWGPFSTASSSQPSRICSCKGHGGVEGVTLWGPEGASCAGIADWGKYDQECKDVAQLSICGCVGNGNILQGMTLWGPKDSSCGGFSVWGTYNQTCQSPR
jgi:hypothetical protein